MKRDKITSLTNVKIIFNEVYEHIIDNIQNTTTGKRLDSDHQDIKVITSHETVGISGVIPIELALPTTAKTSGCLLSWVYNYIHDSNKFRQDYLLPIL